MLNKFSKLIGTRQVHTFSVNGINEKIEFRAPKKLSSPIVPKLALSNSIFLSSKLIGL